MRIRVLAAAALALVLAVLAASAAIRLGQPLAGFPTGALRLAQRVAASLEVLAMIGIAVVAWRRRVVALAATLTVFLSVLGIAAGQQPPPAAAAGNLLGGLALAAAFGWLLGCSAEKTFREKTMAGFAAALIVLQCLLGAWVAILSPQLWTPGLVFHWLAGVALVSGALWLAFLCRPGLPRYLLLGLALLALASGYSAIIFERPFGAALMHAVAGAFFVAAAGYAHARLA